MARDADITSVDELIRQQQTRKRLMGLWMMLTCIVVFGASGALSTLLPSGSTVIVWIAAISAVICIAVPIIIWNNPKMGLYILFAGAMVFEGVTNGYGQSTEIITSYIPFFWNLNNLGNAYGTGALAPFKFSLAEAVMMLTFLSWLIRAIVMRQFRFEPGAFFWSFFAYLAMVTVGFFRGIAGGGDPVMALWEVRSQYHLFFAYLIATNLLREKKDVVPILWITIIGAGIKGLVGLNAIAMLKGPITEQGVLYHEEALFFNVLFLMCFMLMMSRADERLKKISFVCVPVALYIYLQNQRRAGIAAFVIAVIALLPIMGTILEKRRKAVVKFTFTFLGIAAVYMPIAWNGKGAWALPARAIRSNFDPDERDAGSDYYRLAEMQNLKATRNESPIIGIGYGRAYRQDVVQPGLEKFDEFLKYMPHNSVMWVWMRIGNIGFFIFMMLLATILIKGVQILKRTQDPLLQIVGCMGVASVLMLFTFGKYDLALVNYRIVIMTGTFVGVLGVLRRLDPEALAAPHTEELEGGQYMPQVTDRGQDDAFPRRDQARERRNYL